MHVVGSLFRVRSPLIHAIALDRRGLAAARRALSRRAGRMRRGMPQFRGNRALRAGLSAQYPRTCRNAARSAARPGWSARALSLRATPAVDQPQDQDRVSGCRDVRRGTDRCSRSLTLRDSRSRPGRRGSEGGAGGPIEAMAASPAPGAAQGAGCRRRAAPHPARRTAGAAPRRVSRKAHRRLRLQAPHRASRIACRAPRKGRCARRAARRRRGARRSRASAWIKGECTRFRDPTTCIRP
jgi:hypothetical protein